MELIAAEAAAGTTALLVGISVLVVVAVVLAVLGPQWGRAGRWRPGQPWLNEPIWFGRPGDEVPTGVVAISAGSAVSADEVAEPTVGGAHGQW